MTRHATFAVVLAAASFGVFLQAPARGADTRRVQLAALFGESDEEKAARQQHEDNQDLATQALQQRVHDLEDSLRQLTGQNEQLAHQIQELNEKLERQQKDFEYRLCAMTAQQLGSAPGAPGQPALSCNPGGAPAQAMAAPEGPNGPPPLPSPGRISGTLGTLSQGDTAAPAPPAAATRSEFQTAMNLLAKNQFDEARAAFRSFADTNPTAPSASLAVYWIGRIAYVQKDYVGAERNFAEVIKKYPTSASAPESMLRLGQSLLASGQKKDGCTFLAGLKKKYPNAAKNLLEEAADAHKAACKR